MFVCIYVKATSNCEGLPLQIFERLGPEWTGESLELSLGEITLEVVGWSDLFGGSPCPVHVARVRWLGDQPLEGYLVWGGNAGVRILYDAAEPTPEVDEHLPRGWGMPVLWLESVESLPPEVQAIVRA